MSSEEARLNGHMIVLTGFHCSFLDAGARFSKAPETCRARKAIIEISNPRITELFYSHFRIWAQVPFIQEVSGVFRYRRFKNVFTDPKSFRDFREMGPRSRWLSAFEPKEPLCWNKVLLNYCHQYTFCQARVAPIYKQNSAINARLGNVIR